MNVYARKDFKFLIRKHILKGQKIYGFIPQDCNGNFIVYGGKQFAIVEIKSNNEENVIVYQLFNSIVCDDWIQAAIWKSSSEVTLLTAHNAVQVY